MSKKPGAAPWTPPPYGIADVQAIRALIIGEATPDQQQRALRWIIEVAAGTYDQSFYPGAEDGRRNTDFAEGRRFVGNQIVKLTKINTSSMNEGE